MICSSFFFFFWICKVSAHDLKKATSFFQWMKQDGVAIVNHDCCYTISEGEKTRACSVNPNTVSQCGNETAQ